MGARQVNGWKMSAPKARQTRITPPERKPSSRLRLGRISEQPQTRMCRNFRFKQIAALLPSVGTQLPPHEFFRGLFNLAMPRVRLRGRAIHELEDYDEPTKHLHFVGNHGTEERSNKNSLEVGLVSRQRTQAQTVPSISILVLIRKA